MQINAFRSFECTRQLLLFVLFSLVFVILATAGMEACNENPSACHVIARPNYLFLCYLRWAAIVCVFYIHLCHVSCISYQICDFHLHMFSIFFVLLRFPFFSLCHVVIHAFFAISSYFSTCCLFWGTGVQTKLNTITNVSQYDDLDSENY